MIDNIRGGCTSHCRGTVHPESVTGLKALGRNTLSTTTPSTHESRDMAWARAAIHRGAR